MVISRVCKTVCLQKVTEMDDRATTQSRKGGEPFKNELLQTRLFGCWGEPQGSELLGQSHRVFALSSRIPRA